jgi:hypothetical protein
MTSRIQHFSNIRLNSSIYFLLIVSLLLTDIRYMALGAFQASLNIVIHYERFYNGFYAPYFYMPLLGCNTKITDKFKLNVFTHI